jgi:hypothetical protein
MPDSVRAVVATLVLFVVPGRAESQSTSANVSITAPLEQQFVGDLTLLHDKVVALAKAIPVDKYSWRPSTAVRTVSQIFMHMAGEWFFLCPRSVGAPPPADFGAPAEKFRTLEAITAKADVLAQLDQAWAHCSAALAAISPARLVPDSLPSHMGFPRVVLLVSGDQHEHLGQLIAYARSLGVTPPWSQ